MRSQHYAQGHYCIREGLPFASELERYIRKLDFLGISESFRINVASQRKRHRLYVFSFAPAGFRVVMKVDTVDARYSRLRQLELRIAGLIRDGLKRSYLGSLALEQAGIPSIRPLAQWTYRRSLLSRDSYFLYEAIETDEGVKTYRDRIAQDLNPERYANFTRLVEMMAQLTRRLHDAGLRHGDIVTGNFLIFGHERDAHGELAIGDRTRLYLIDTDHIQRARISFAPIKRFFDLRCLRRLDFDDEGVRFFLRRYLGTEQAEIPCALRFWERGGFKLSHWIKRRGKKTYSSLNPREPTDRPALPG